MWVSRTWPDFICNVVFVRKCSVFYSLGDTISHQPCVLRVGEEEGGGHFEYEKLIQKRKKRNGEIFNFHISEMLKPCQE